LLPKGYTQFGTLHGTVKINEPSKSSGSTDGRISEKTLYLHGFRLRRYLMTNKPIAVGHSQAPAKRFEMFGMSEYDGTIFRLVGLNG
jgi:hypothetical protein